MSFLDFPAASGVARRADDPPSVDREAGAAAVRSLGGSEGARRAFTFASRRLVGRARRDAGDPALVHAFRVALIVRDVFGVRGESAVATALLHDVLEDSATSMEQLRGNFGRRVAEAVVVLTKPRFGAKAARRALYRRVLRCAPEETVLVKLADFLDNVRSRRGTPRGEVTARNALAFLRDLRCEAGSDAMRRAAAILGAECELTLARGHRG